MNIWKITYNEIERGNVSEFEPVRVDPAIVACGGDGLDACSVLSDAVRGPRQCDDCDTPGEVFEWEVIGIEVVGIELIVAVDHVDANLLREGDGDD